MIMDNEKLYKEALKKAREYKKRGYMMINAVLDNIFPELKESEDERIRKELIKFVKVNIPDEERYIAWLEKQVSIDKEKMLIGARRDVASSIITYLDRNTLGMCLSNMECEDLVNAVVDSDWGKVYDYMKKKLEKQGDKPQGKTAIEAIKEEKVDNANIVKSKFKGGDYIIHQGTGNIYQVISCIDNQYQLKYVDTYTIQKCDDVDRHARLLDVPKDVR